METDHFKKKQLLQCIFCQQNDNQEHIILKCSHPPLIKIRKTIIKSLHRSATPLLRNTNPLIKAFTQRFLHHATATQSTFVRRLWLGLWSKELIEVLFEGIIYLQLIFFLLIK
jgi:hypothetical protein